MTSEAFLLSMQWLNSFLLHMVVKWALSMRFINPCVSHMPIACPFVWHASLVGSTWAVYVRRMSLVVLSIEFMFPLSSFCVKRWRFGALIALSASSVLFQMLPFAYWTYKSIYSFGLTKQLTVFRFLISGLLWNFGDAGASIPVPLACKASALPSELHPRWGNGAISLWNLTSVIEIVEQSPLLHIVVILALSVRVINPFVSHMPIVCPPDWHASLVGSTWAVYVRRMSLIVLSVEFMFSSTSFWGKPWRFGALIAFSASSVLFQMLPFPYWTNKSMSSFGVTKQLSVFPFLISRLLWKIGDPGH